MPLIYCGRPTIRHPALGFEPVSRPVCHVRLTRRFASTQSSDAAPQDSAPKPALTNVLFKQLIKTCIRQTQNKDYPASPRDNTDKCLKPKNPDLYYVNLYIKYYYFCQQCENHFEIVGLLGHKHILFVVGFLKNCILNCWQ